MLNPWGRVPPPSSMMGVWVMRAVSGAALGVGLGLLIHAPWFFIYSTWHGRQLIADAQRRHPVGRVPRQVSVSSIGPTAPSPHGVPPNPASGTLIGTVAVPALGITAPVVQGTAMSTLASAAGHLPTSVMPGGVGTSVIAAHNATWFHPLRRVQRGMAIVVTTSYGTWTYHVTHWAVVRTGSTVANTTTPQVVLEACWPLDALYFTPYRFLVWGTLVRSDGRTPSPTTPTTAPMPSYHPVGIPAAVQRQGLSLTTNYVPMGTLTHPGAPTAWVASPAPLTAADATTTVFLAVEHIAELRDAAAWHSVAPSIPVSALTPWWGATVRAWDTPLDEQERVTRTGVLTATQGTVTVQLAGGSAPGVYRIVWQTTVTGAAVRLAAWTMTRL